MKRVLLSETDIPSGNLKEEILQYFYDCVADEVDRRKIEAYVNYVVDTQTFVLPESPDAEIWPTPPPMSMSNYSYQVIAKMPVFPSTEVLLMDRYTASPLLQWNMSRWISQPFRRIQQKKQSNHDEVVAKLETFKQSIPPFVELPDEDSSPLTQFCLSEVERFNSAISLLRGHIELCLTDTMSCVAMECISQDVVPQDWQRIMGCTDSSAISRFTRTIRDRHEFYTSWVKNGRLPKTVDVRLIWDVKMLLTSYLHEISLQRGQPIGSMSCRLSLSQDGDAGLILTNLWLTGANWSSGDNVIIESHSKTPPFSRIPELYCAVVQQPDDCDPPTSDVYSCPLFPGLPGHCPSPRLSGPLCYVPIPSRVPPSLLTLSGAALLCHVPDHMT